MRHATRIFGDGGATRAFRPRRSTSSLLGFERARLRAPSPARHLRFGADPRLEVAPGLAVATVGACEAQAACASGRAARTHVPSRSEAGRFARYVPGHRARCPASSVASSRHDRRPLGRRRVDRIATAQPGFVALRLPHALRVVDASSRLHSLPSSCAALHVVVIGAPAVRSRPFEAGSRRTVCKIVDDVQRHRRRQAPASRRRARTRPTRPASARSSSLIRYGRRTVADRARADITFAPQSARIMRSRSRRSGGSTIAPVGA